MSRIPTEAISCDLSKFNPDSVIYAHYYEPFNSNKEYESEIFSCDFGHGTRNYRYYKLIVYDSSDAKLEKQVFMIARQVLSDQEIKKLLPYCQCSAHTRSYFNPRRYCGHSDLNCIKSDFETSQYLIDATIKKYNEYHNI
jgi:hypothetical protein